MVIFIKDILDKSGMTRYELANRIGVTYPTIDKIYKSKSTSIKFETLDALCKELHCTPNDILIEKKDVDMYALHTRYKLHIRYKKVRKVNGWGGEFDSMLFDSMDELLNHTQGKLAYDYLDNSVKKTENEILLYAEDERGNVVWGKKSTMRE